MPDPATSWHGAMATMGPFDRLVAMVHAELRRIARRHMGHERLMRRVLIDWARARGYQKRGTGAHNVTLDEGRVGIVERPADLIALDDALNTLAELTREKVRSSSCASSAV